MKGDIIVLEPHHIEAGNKIAQALLLDIKSKNRRYIITVSGESGSGKSETAKAISDELFNHGIKCAVLGQDDYFVLPPKSNDAKRREDSSWLGPHAEVKMDLLNSHIQAALGGEESIIKPLISYDENKEETETVSLKDVDVLILEGTYTALLRKVDCRVFINRNRLDTLEHRQKRNRGSEVGDPFIEDVLKTEHKIIAGHKYLADIVITKDYEVIIKQ
ncbi:MAG: zeta toxin family protein [Clostridia bacterium]|nr:zeta toxin family protein [Clostridia bacterium]